MELYTCKGRFCYAKSSLNKFYTFKAMAMLSLWEKILFLPQDTDNLSKMKMIEFHNLDVFFSIKIFIDKVFFCLILNQSKGLIFEYY